MSLPPPIEPERLLAQTAWVKRLALSLARDESSADDLVQETFFEALRRPPPNARNEGGLRAWLAAVARHAAFRQSRERGRREQRERATARVELAGSEERALELEQLRAELFRHVMALPEISKQVVLLRYFEELDSAEIARRLEIPDSTVRNRLRRALAELRERMQRAHGSDWRDLCLFVIPGAGRKAAVGSGVAAAAAVGGSWILAGAAVAIVLIAWLAWPSSRSNSVVPNQIAELAPSVTPGLEEARAPHAETTEPSRVSEGIAGVDSRASKQGPPSAIRVSGTVRDEHGQLVPELSMQWFDEAGTRLECFVRAGGFELDGLHAGTWIIATGGIGWRDQQVELALDPVPREQRHDLTVHSSVFLPVRLVERSGKQLLVCEPSGPSVAGRPPERDRETS